MVSIVQVGNVQSVRANGVHAATRRVTQHLLSDGHDVEVWHFSRSVGEVVTRDDAGIRVVDLPVHGLPGALGSYVQLPTSETRRWVRDRARTVSVVHLHSVFQPDHLWVARLGVPYVLAPHGGYHNESFRGPGGAMKRFAVLGHERRLLQGARWVQVLSADEGRSVQALAPGARRLQLPFPLDQAVDVPHDRAYRHDGPVVFLGRLDIRHKGLDLLLEAVSRVKVLFGDRRLLLVGPSVGDSGRWLKTRVRELGMAHMVEIRPALHDRGEVRRLLEDAALFVHPSRWEGLPTGVLEAMVMGLPVLVTEATNLGDLVREAGCGVVTGVSALSVAAGLEAALGADAASRAAMGRRGRDTVRGSFSWERLRPGYRELYTA